MSTSTEPREQPASAGHEPLPAQEPPPSTAWSSAQWATLAVLCGALFLDAMDVSSVNVALPTIGRSLSMSTASLQWVVSGYVLGYGGFLLLGGRVADLLGRRRVFLISLALFAVASAVGGIVDSGTLLIITRLIKGVAAAFTVPAGLSLLTTTFSSDADRPRALGAYAATAAAGFSLGLVIGGLLSELGWRYVFLVPAPIAAVFIFTCQKVLASDPPREPGPRRYDAPGALCVTAGALILVYTVVEAPTHGWTTARTLGGFILCAALLIAFIIIELRSEQPLVRLDVLRSGSLVSADIAALTYFGSYLGFQFLATLYVQEVAHWSPILTALAFLPSGAFLPVLGAQAPRLIGRFGTSRLIAAGLIAFAAGYALFLNAHSTHFIYATMLLPTMIALGIGWGVAFPALNVQATAGIDNSEQGLAAGLLSSSLQIGGAIGVAIAGAVVAGHANPGARPGSEVMASITPTVVILGAVALIGLAAVAAFGLANRRTSSEESVSLPIPGAAGPCIDAEGSGACPSGALCDWLRTQPPEPIPAADRDPEAVAAGSTTTAAGMTGRDGRSDGV